MTESEWSGTESRTGEDAIWQLASGLSAAATPMQIAEVLAEHGAPAAGAAFSNMALLQADGGTVRAVHGSALDEGMAARWAEFELDSSTPLGDAMLSGAAVLLGTLDEVAARYPHPLAGRRQSRRSHQTPRRDCRKAHPETTNCSREPIARKGPPAGRR